MGKVDSMYHYISSGIVAVFDFHNHNKIPNMYSLHSWCGMLTFVLFCVQVSPRLYFCAHM